MKLLPRRFERPVLGAMHSLGEGRQCPICGWTGSFFLPFGTTTINRRADCFCPRCKSLERHRIAYMVATEVIDLQGADILHVAPEPCLTPLLKKSANEYLSIDLEFSNYSQAMREMDTTKLDLPDNSFTIYWSSHVFEHIPDDAAAIREAYRVLKPGGMAVIQVPIWGKETYEDWSITTPEDRLRVFHQEDHVRIYGLDIVDRFEAAGFKSRIVRAQDFGPEKLFRHGLSCPFTDEVFLFTK